MLRMPGCINLAALPVIVALLLGCCRECCAHDDVQSASEWATKRHDQGWCAMYGVCADRPDGGSLNCPANIPAPRAEKQAADILLNLCPDLWASSGGHLCCSGEQAGIMHQQLRRAEPFIIGCPACMSNFRNLFCSLFCSPDQATFTNITQVQKGSRKESRGVNHTVVEEVSFYLSEEFKNDTYNSCKDVIFGSANSHAMTYIGNNAHKAQDFFNFIGEVKDRKPIHIGSPFQLNFEPGDPEDVPEPMIALHQHLPTCWDSVLKCSCGDCPDAPTCGSHAPAFPKAKPSCTLGSIWGVTVYCSNLVALVAVVVSLPSLCWLWGAGRLGTDAQVTAMDSDGGRSRSPSPEPACARPSSPGSVQEYLVPPVTRRSSHFQSDDDEEDVHAQNLNLPLAMQPLFAGIGRVVASSPRLTILICICFTSLCTLGLMGLYVDTDPFLLWAPPHSRAAMDKQAYDEAFGPFYRIEQLILSTVPEDGAPQPILQKQNIEFVFDIHDMIDNISVSTYDGHEVTLQAICYKPFGEACAIESIAQYWQMDRTNYESRHTSLKQCLSHWSIDCRSTFEAPIEPKMVLGGYPNNSTDYLADTTALLITLPVNNNSSMTHKILQWEAHFLTLVEELIAPKAKDLGLAVSWSAQSSIQNELGRESFLDTGTVALSYAAMLIYIALALGRFSFKAQSCKERIVGSRVLLGLGGVVVVICSVVGGLGICSAMGVSASLIVMEVVPFLVLAIGVDNMFLIAAEEELQPQDLPVEERVANALGSVGPSITMSTICEVLAFLAAAVTQVPAVRHFALVAAASVTLDYLLQITAFVAILTLDCERMQRGYADMVPCIQLLPPAVDLDVPDYQVEEVSSDEDAGTSPTNEASQLFTAQRSGMSKSGVQVAVSGALVSLHRNFLSTESGKLFILVLALLLNAAALISLSHMRIGLDQQVALPKDSYLQQYYRDVMQYARVGPPVMFVVEGMNISMESPDIDLVSGCATCKEGSLVNTIAQASQDPLKSHIASPAASWVDDFLAWIQPELPNCCRVHTDGAQEDTFCPAPDVSPCTHFDHPCADCNTCLRPSDLEEGRPTTEDTLRLLPGFLKAKPSKQCAKGGLGVYSSLIEADSSSGIPVGLSNATVTSAFRALSSPLATQEDFISALLASRHIVDSVQATLKDAYKHSDGTPPRVYMYSIFHPFFEQFVSIVSDSIAVLGMACLLVLLVSFLFTGSAWLSLIIGLTLASMLLDIAGVLPLVGVQLNAVSLVNMSMCAGIGLEFITHIAHSFMRANGTREERCATAMAGKGAAVCSGILLTKLVGVAMLAFSSTQIFTVYYFRMYMTLVVVGAFHSLLLLPVLLSLTGPEQVDKWASSEHVAEETPEAARGQVYVHRTRVLISRRNESTGSDPPE